jgi:hypothetical protein
MTADLLELADWLSVCQVTHVAMESTGVHLEGHQGTCWKVRLNSWW